MPYFALTLTILFFSGAEFNGTTFPLVTLDLLKELPELQWGPKLVIMRLVYLYKARTHPLAVDDLVCIALPVQYFIGILL